MNDLRIGHGYDIHRLQQGGRLMMGGVVVAEGISAVAHSDGDIVIHAIVDALLGAAGLGDIGQHFPDSELTWKNASSKVFLEHTMKLLCDAGWRVGNCDVSVLAEKPKLKPFNAQMIANLGEILKAPVNIKAGTNEGCGEIGRGEAVAAHAVVLIVGER